MSTLHTNSAAAAVSRLVDMGVEPFLIATALNAVLAQRLVRRLCPVCAEPYEPSAALLDTLKVGGARPAISRLFRPHGCPACDHGFRGRVAVLELLVMDETIADLVMARAEGVQIDWIGSDGA